VRTCDRAWIMPLLEPVCPNGGPASPLCTTRLVQAAKNQDQKKDWNRNPITHNNK